MMAITEESFSPYRKIGQTVGNLQLGFILRADQNKCVDMAAVEEDNVFLQDSYACIA